MGKSSDSDKISQAIERSVVFGDAIQIANVTGSVTIAVGRAPYRVEVFDDSVPHLAVGIARAQPSRLLLSRNRVVPFIGRATEVADLLGWATAGESFSVHLLHGPGGQGKTRLAQSLASNLASAGWDVWNVLHGVSAQPENAVPVVSQHGLIAVVDYADRWPASDLSEFLRHAFSVHTEMGIKTRILLLSRSAGFWWSAISDDLDRTVGVPATQQTLTPLDDRIAREELYLGARRSFAQALAVELSDEPAIPPELQNDSFGQVLAVHMLALVTVDAYRRGEDVVVDPSSLSAYLLNREMAHWHDLHERSKDSRPTRPDAMRRATYIATLLGPVSYTDARRVLTAAEVTNPSIDDVIDDHSFCYPAPISGMVLQGLLPDRLGEDLIGLTTPADVTEVGTWHPDPWATSAASILLADSTDATYGPRVVTVLVETARRWPHIAHKVLYPLIREKPGLAVGSGGATLARLANLPDVDVSVLEAIEEALPKIRDINLDIAIVSVSARLTDQRLEKAEDSTQRARIYAAHASRLSMAGLAQEALEPALRALEIRQMLAGNESEERLNELSDSLDTAGTILFSLGQNQQALQLLVASADIHYRFLDSNPLLHYQCLAETYNKIGPLYDSIGQSEKGLQACEIATSILRQLTEQDAVYEISLSIALNNLGNRYNNRGDRLKALEASTEAVEIRRRLAAEHPEIYLPNLATSLNNMANYLSDLGRYDESVEIAMEAIGIRRELVAMNPFGHSLDLATSLNDITVTFSRNGNDVEAVTFGEEAISIYRDLELLGRRGHEPYLAVALANNIATLANTGRIDEAAAAGAEAWERLEELLTTDSRLIIELARCTESLGGVLERLRRDDEAIAALERSIELFHSLSDRPNLTRKLPAKLSRLIDVLIRTGRADDALQRVDELTQIWATIVEDQPDLLPDFAGNLGDFAMRLALFKGFEAKALPLAEQVAVLSETLADQSPTEFLTLHAQALTAVSILLQRTDRLPEAIAVGDRALMIHRRIPEGDSVDHLETLARALGQQGSMCNRGGDVLRGLSLLEEGIEIFRRLSAENPNTLGELAGMLVGFASACGASGTRAGDAFSAVLEAIEIYRLLVEQNPAEYGGGFMEAHRLLLLLLESVGRHEDAAELRLMLGE